MNIIILTPGFAADEDDTTCIPGLQDLVLAYRRIFPEMNIKIISFHYPFAEREYEWNGVTIYAAGGQNSKIWKLRTWLRVVRKIRLFHKKSPIHILHAFWLTDTTVVGQIASRLYGIPLIATIMGQDAKRDNKYLPIIVALSKTLLQKNFAVFALSDFAANICTHSSGINVQGITPFGVVPFGIKPALQAEEVKSLAKMRNIDILGVGSVIPLKNYSFFLSVIASLKRSRKDIQSVILGEFVDEDELQRLKQIVSTLQLENNVVFIGKVARSEVFSAMAQSKVLLHTSLYEGQGWVLLEALYYGASVVSMNVGYAAKHSQMYVCQSSDEVASTVNKALDKKENNNYSSINTPVLTINETAYQYIDHYKSSILSSAVETLSYKK